MATFRVGSPPFTLILAQVVPGYDGEVAHAIANHFTAEGESRPEVRKHIYFAFSEYDVLAIVPLSREGYLDRLTTFGHDHVRDLQQILCFPWTAGATRTSDFQPGPALTLTFFKLDENLLGEEGIHAEYDAVHWLQEQIHKVRKRKENRRVALDGIVLGTLGWPELLLMLAGSDLSVLLRIVRDLATTPIRRSDKPPLLFTFSHTLPCVRWDGNPKGFSAESVSGRVSCQVMVSARPEYLSQVVQRVGNLLPGTDPPSATDAPNPAMSLWDAGVVFGRRDLLVAPREHQPMSVDSIVRLLSILRSRESSHRGENTEDTEAGDQPPLITATHTHISVPMPQGAVTEVQAPESRRQISSLHDIWSRLEPRLLFGFRRKPSRVEEEEEVPAGVAPLHELLSAIEWFGNWERRLGNPGLAHAGRLRQMLFRYQAVQCTPELQGIVDDMTKVLARAIDDAVVLSQSVPPPPTPIVPQDVREEYGNFEEIANLFFFGLDQRLAGAVFGVSDPARAYTHLHALGIQRILRAADAIPRALLRLMRTHDRALDWPGFVVFGYCNETAKLAFNVLNMPYQDVATPSEWWRLAHEAGHACVDLQSFSDFPGFQAMFRRLENCDLEDVAADPPHLLDELAANVFAFEFAFRCHFDFYLRTAWRFFNRYLEGREQTDKTDLLLRALFVFLYDLERQEILDPGQAVDDAIKEGRDQPTISEDKSLDRSRSLCTLGEYEDLEDLIRKEIIQRTVKAAPKVAHGIRGVPVGEIAERYRLCEPWRTDVADLFQRLRFEDPYVRDLKQRLERYWQLLQAGKTLDDIPDQDLFLLPLALQHHYQGLEDRGDGTAATIPMRARIACILSLWHWDRKHAYPSGLPR